MTEVQEQLDIKNDDQQIEFAKRGGTSGASKGHKYEIKLAMLFLLQGKMTKEIENFYLASNMDGVGAFDDVVFMYSYNENEVKKTSIIFLQAKHKESTKVFNLDSLFPRGKGDFDLRKYLRSYKDIKQQFKTNRNNPIFEKEFENSNYFIFTNTSFDFNNCKEDVEEYEMEQENFLNLKNDAQYYKIKDSDKVMRALKETPSTNMPDEDEEIRDFLNKLKIFDGQFNEKELEDEINTIIGSVYSVDKSEASLIFFEVYREVETWWQSEKTHYITGKNMFFENAKEKISKRGLAVVASMGRAQMNTLKLQFEEGHVKKIKALIDENQILNIVTKTVTLTNAKVYQALEDMTEYKSKESEENDYKYLFISSELTTNIQNKIINTFKSTQFNLLVFGCERNKYNFKNLYDKLFHIIKGDENKKIIMIGQENKKNTIFDGMAHKYKKYEDTEILSDLTDNSQEELINNVMAIFQGEEIILGKLLKDKKIRKFIDTEMLSELVNAPRINIGESLKSVGEIQKYYIRRRFNRRVNIRADFKNEKSIFFVTKNNEITEEFIELNEDIVLISDVEDDFYKISTDENYKTKNIHRLKEEDGVFTWQQSYGSLSNLCNFIDAQITNSVEEEDMIKKNDKLVIISAEPGMGKTTVLTNLSEQIKNSDPFLWVHLINLNDHTVHLENMDLNQHKKEEAIKVLLNIVKPKHGLETELFKRKINEEGKIVLLFDGFDEISPTYDIKVIELLNVLKDTKADQLWVTTRPHLRRQLEDKLGIIAYTLKALTEDNQKTFLKNFWNQRLGLNIELDIRTDSFIRELLNVLKKSISDEELQFTGVPLQTRMLAEVFQETFKNFHDSVELPNFPKTLNLVYLYQEFIDKKCRIFFEEKKKFDLTTTYAKKDYNKFSSDFFRNHKILGIDLIFYEENEFLSMDEQNVLKKFKNDFNEEEDKIGIVIQIRNDKPIFVHRTFGEYFAALWIADKVEENNTQVKNKLLKYIFKNGYEFVKIVFDRLLTKDKCKIHNAILNNDEKTVKLLLDDGKIFDKGGRTAIHLAASYGYEHILKILLEHSKKVGSIFNDKIDTKDKVFNLSGLMYAVKGYHTNTVEMLLQNGAKSDDMFEPNSGINETTVTLIHLAAEKGCMKLIEVILENGSKYRPITHRIAAKIGKFLLNRKDSYHIDYKNNRFETPLYTAVINEQIEVVKLLVDNGANINDNDDAIVHNAVHKGNKEIVKFLINKGADTNAVAKIGLTPLYVAVEYEQLEVVKLLVDNGANINTKDIKEKWSVLHMAAFKGNKEIVEYLINKGADTNAVNNRGKTPLFVAVEYEQIEVVKLLVDNGAVINGDDDTIFHKAAHKGNKEIVEFLIKKGADTNAVAKIGLTPLYVAVEYENIEIVKLLVDNGANINAKDIKQSWSILHVAAYKGNKQIVEFLINKGADTNTVNNRGESPLYIGIEHEQVEVVKLLVDNGANINTKDIKANSSVLHMAAFKGNKEIVEYLIFKGADTNAVNNRGRTPLFVAVEYEQIDVVKLLVDNGANINGGDDAIFHKAAHKGNMEIVEFLLNKGADINAVNSRGETPLHVAVKYERIEVVVLLMDNGANI